MPSNFIEADNVDQIVTLGNDYGELEKSEVTNPAGNSDVEDDDEVAAESSKKEVKTRRTSLRKAAAKDSNDAPETTSPKATNKGGKGKKNAVAAKVKAEGEDAVEGEADYPSMADAPPTKKRAATGDIDATSKKQKKGKAVSNDVETPSKTPKGKISKFPESAEEFTEQDKLLVQMKNQGKAWPEIEKAWSQITGVAPGKDVLRKRYPKLVAVGHEWAVGDIGKMVIIKTQIDASTVEAVNKALEDHQAAVKKIHSEKWGKIAEALKAVGGSYPGAAIEKKWNLMVKNGEVDMNGNYTGPDPMINGTSAGDHDGVMADAEVNVDADEDGDADDEHAEE